MIPEVIKVSSDPAAGVEITYVADEDMIVRSCHFQFNTDATAVSRLVNIVADDGNSANVFFRSAAGGASSASSGHFFSAFEAASFNTGAGFGRFSLSLPANGLRLRKGDRLRTLTDNLQAGDNLSAVTIQAERMMRGPQ